MEGREIRRGTRDDKMAGEKRGDRKRSSRGDKKQQRVIHISYFLSPLCASILPPGLK
uniref:Uncharacterized protein n=1 Tax=Anatid alphaherpesvirus 2 TaxID=3080522 RepID=A0AAU0K7Z8_9ALPH